MNVAQHKSTVENLQLKTDVRLKKNGQVYLSLPLGQLSCSQIRAVVHATEKFLKQSHITITENLNIDFGEHKESVQKDIFNFFIRSGLLVLGCDSAITHEGSCAEIKDEDKVIIANVPEEKITTSMFMGFAELMQKENIQDIHLVNEKEFVFICHEKCDIDVLKKRLERLGINLRAVL